MKFYRGNRVDGEFEAPVNHVAGAFWRSLEGADVLRHGMPLERALRDFLTDHNGFNSSWEDESNETGFGALYAETRRLWPQVSSAEIDPDDLRPGPDPDYSVNHIS